MVIQRWQSLLLLIAVAMMACFTFVPLGQVQTTDFTYSFTSLGFSYVGEATDGAPTGYAFHTWFFFVLSLSTTVLLLIDIFLFKNLPLQKKVCLVCLLLVLASAGCAFSLGYSAVPGGEMQWCRSMIYACPIMAVVSIIMAYNRMQSDHRKLKAVDRIR